MKAKLRLDDCCIVSFDYHCCFANEQNTAFSVFIVCNHSFSDRCYQICSHFQSLIFL